MNKPKLQNATDGPAKTGDQTQPKRSEPAFTRFEPKRAADQVVHQVMPEDVIKAKVAPTPAKGAVNPVPRAPLGDDDVTEPVAHVPVRVLH